MYIVFGKYIVQVFGIYFIVVGVLMLLKPITARAILRKAGSTNLINYTEITLRIIPATGLILASPISKYPFILQIFGWFMIGTSLVLYFIPRTLHHNFSNKCADVLKPQYFLLIAPFSIAIGFFLVFGFW
ncbi:hypothetical protein [Flavobacterium sp. SM2513]|uniref:hypothetical protein n=1 Tax=Flavobacterium sp. SM2513 TaxID=3424766 RepID=UPI003D7F28EF